MAKSFKTPVLTTDIELLDAKLTAAALALASLRAKRNKGAKAGFEQKNVEIALVNLLDAAHRVTRPLDWGW